MKRQVILINLLRVFDLGQEVFTHFIIAIVITIIMKIAIVLMIISLDFVVQ